MTLETIQIESGPNPAFSAIWMHGLGADGSDFVPIVNELDLPACPPIRFVFPHAPAMPVTINGGYVMPAWYDILGTGPAEREDEAGIRASQSAIEALIAHEKTRGIAADHIVLAGFSQGCAIALQTGLRHSEKLAGLLCLSGYVPINATLAAERHAANRDTPIFMGHGRADPVIPIERAEKSRDLLLSLGYQVEWREYRMEHSVCEEEIDDIGEWLKRIVT